MSEGYEHDVDTGDGGVEIVADDSLSGVGIESVTAVATLADARDIAAQLGMAEGSCCCDCTTQEGVRQFTEAYYAAPQNPVVFCQEWPEGVTSASGVIGIPGITVVVPGLPVLDPAVAAPADGVPGRYDDITITGPDGQPVDRGAPDPDVWTTGGPDPYDGITITGPDGQPVDPSTVSTTGVAPQDYTTTYGPGADPNLYPSETAPESTTAVVVGPETSSSSGSFVDTILEMMAKVEPNGPQWNQLQQMLDSYHNMIRVWVT